MRFVNPFPKHEPAYMIKDLRDLVVHAAERFGNNTLYQYKQGSEFVSYTYADLLSEMNAFGTALALRGLLGSTVTVTGDLCPRYVTAYLSTVNGNGVIVPIDKDVSEEETLHFLQWSETRAVVYTAVQKEKILSIAKSYPEGVLFIAAENGALPGAEELSCGASRFVAFDTLLKEGKSALEAGNTDYTGVTLDMEKMCTLLFTSGTTGSAKGVMLSQKNLTAATNSSDQSMPYGEWTNYVAVLPPHHTYEMTCEQFGNINLGAKITINDTLRHLPANLKRFRPNTMVFVPLYVETLHKRVFTEIRKKGKEKTVRFAMKLSNALLACGIDLRRKLFREVLEGFGGELTSIVCGGAKLSPELVKDFHTFGILIMNGYGITECAPLLAVNRCDCVNPESVGTPVYGVTVAIDKEDPNDETGEIVATGDNVMLGYYKNEEANREVFFEKDGKRWFRTGDIGYIDEKGFIYITGRKKNVIIASNGKNVFPEEIEEHLASIEEIGECVVLGRKNEKGEEIITAICVANAELPTVEALSEEELLKLLRQKINTVNQALPAYKRVQEVELRKEPFERNTSKKIQRFKVK